MPELTDQQLKDRVQKLENLLRAREERIVALETENAMLYLKLAQCQGSVRSCRHESTHYRRLFDEEKGFRKNSLQTLRNSSDKLQEVKLELHDLRKKVKALPELLSQEMDKTTKLTDQFGSMKMSNMEDFCKSNAAGVHANPDDCNGFIMCDMAGIAHEMDCPAGLKFNPALLVCDWPNNVECEDGSGEPAGYY